MTYFYAVLSDGTVEGNRTAFFLIGGFMAVWIIFYGVVQASAPKLLGAARRNQTELVTAAKSWALGLLGIISMLALVVSLSIIPVPLEPYVLTIGLIVFGGVFAVNSSLHSYLILAFTNSNRVTLDVGFYYMANASGRLVGTLLSGLTFQLQGLALCLITASVMVGLSTLAARRLETA